MNNKDFITELSQRLGYSAKDTATLQKTLTDELAERLVEENASIMVKGFGTFYLKKKMERMMLNPNTREHILIPPKILVNFKSSPSAKTKLNGNNE